MRRLVLLASLSASLAAQAVAQVVAAPVAAADRGQLVSVGAGVAAALLWGMAKGAMGGLDSRLGRMVKPVQPLLVGLLGVALPLVANATHLTTLATPDVFVAAPTAALAGVLARELVARLNATIAGAGPGG